MRFNLPWARGKTARDGNAGTSPVQVGTLGATFIDYDTPRSAVSGANNLTGHGTNVTMLLRPVQIKAGGNSLNFATARVRKGLRASSLNSTSWMTAVNGFQLTAGAFAHVLDDRYGTHATFTDQDAVYTVKQGPVLVPLSTGATGPNAGGAGNFAVGTQMAVRASGGFGRAVTGNVIIGVALQAITNTLTGQTILMHVGCDLGGTVRGR